MHTLPNTDYICHYQSSPESASLTSIAAEGLLGLISTLKGSGYLPVSYIRGNILSVPVQRTPSGAVKQRLTHEINPEVISSESGRGTPCSSTTGVILNECNVDATIKKSVLSAKKRPGHILDTSNERLKCRRMPSQKIYLRPNPNALTSGWRTPRSSSPFLRYRSGRNSSGFVNALSSCKVALCIFKFYVITKSEKVILLTMHSPKLHSLWE